MRAFLFAVNDNILHIGGFLGEKTIRCRNSPHVFGIF
jgi:hypothetical protein